MQTDNISSQPNAPVEPEQETSAVEQERPNPPKWWLVLLLGLLLLGGGGFLGWQWWQSQQTAGQEQQQGQPPTPVETTPVETTTVEDSSQFVGTLEAQQTASLRSESNGEIRAIYVRPGDVVGQGEPLAQIDRRAVEASLAQAEANINRARARLAELQAGPRQEAIAQARARLRQAEANLQDAQSGASPSQIAQAESRIESAQATLNLARQRLERFQTLEAQGAIPTDDLDEAQQRYRTAQADFEEAQRRRQELEETQDSSISRLSAEVEERREALRELETGTRPEEIAQAEADLDAAMAEAQSIEVNLEDTQIIAPFSGTVGDIPLKVGDSVSRGDLFTTLTQNDRLELRLAIPLERSNDLDLGLPVEIFDPDAANEAPLAVGRVNFISPQVDGESQSILVKVAFDNPEGRLRDRQFVRSRIIWQERPDTIVIPTTAITFEGQRRFVFVATGDGETLTAERRQVELGDSQGDQSEILSGLEPGDRLITSGIQKIRDGQPITPSP
ncbi:MAG: efflux RND transporter periplasmic adaptor subunit [Phormidium sp.]